MKNIELKNLLFLFVLLAVGCSKDKLPDGFIGELPNLRIKRKIQTFTYLPGGGGGSIDNGNYETTYEYDVDNRLLRATTKVTLEATEDYEERMEYIYENNRVVEIQAFNSTVLVPDVPFRVEKFRYDGRGRISFEESCYYSQPDQGVKSCFYKRFHYNSNNKVKRIDQFRNEDDEERQSYHRFGWADGNLIWEEQYQGDNDDLRYVRYDNLYDDKINPDLLLNIPPLNYKQSKNNLLRIDAIDGGWYHGPLLSEFEWEYNEDDLPKSMVVDLASRGGSLINRIEYEYEEIP